MIAPKVGLFAGSQTPVYSDADWAGVLQSYVHDGLVDYEALSKDRDGLERYYALLSRTGPTKTPDQLETRSQQVSYWINAYNALAILTVLKHYPVTSMYDLSMPQLEYDYQFQVDGQTLTLAQIRDKALAESDGDARTLLAMSGAAMGTPRVPAQPIRASTLERQLAESAAAAMENSDVLRIDHTTQTILLWQGFLRHQDDFVNWWKAQRRVQSVFLFNVLLELASPPQRRALQTAVGYSLREIPFERDLNRWTAPDKQVAAP